MDFELPERSKQYAESLNRFMDETIFPAEVSIGQSGDDAERRAILNELKADARRRGLWNLYLSDTRYAPGLSNLEYAPLAEIMGWSELASVATNCAAPDTGNVEILLRYATPEAQQTWLPELLGGRITSCFSMTEPDVASSDAAAIRTRIERDGNEYIVTGHKWWTSGADGLDCAFAIVLGASNTDGDPHSRHSMVIVPLDLPGVEIVRRLPVLGFQRHDGGHCEIRYNRVRVPATNILGNPGDGFAMGQARLGPGRLHHCMRAIGAAERALSIMSERAKTRRLGDGVLGDKGVIREWIARSRAEIEQARLLVHKTAWMIDRAGNRSARTEIAAIKAVVPSMAAGVIDRAIQVCGASGLSDDLPLARMYAHLRGLRIADGPDEVHWNTVARNELRRYGNTDPRPARV